MSIFKHEPTDLASEPVSEEQARKEIEKDGPTDAKGFYVKGGWLWCEEKDKDDQSADFKVCTALRVRALTCNEDGVSWGRATEHHDPNGNLHKWAMPASMMSGDGSEYRKVFLDKGLEIEPTRKAKDALSRYLSSSRPKARIMCVEKTGWYRGSFILPAETISAPGNEDVIVFQSERAPRETVKTMGDLEDWKESVGKDCAANTRLALAISHALSGPLRPLMNAGSSGIHFRGNSSLGKTLTLKIAASVFGNPETYMLPWRGTTNGIEAAAYEHNHLPLILDELGQISGHEAGEAAYTLMNGLKKQRATKTGAARQQERWIVALLSSGEVSLEQHMAEAGKKAKAGQNVRLVEIPADTGKGFGIFDDIGDARDSKELFDRLFKGCHASYGTIGWKFIENLASDLKWIKKAKSYKDDFESTYAGYSSQARRVAENFAISAAAGEIATEMGLTGWETGTAISACNECLSCWLDEHNATSASLEEEDMIAQVQGFLTRFNSRFYVTLNGGLMGNQVVRDVAGWKEIIGGTPRYCYVHTHAWPDLCGPHNGKAVTALLAERGILLKDKEGKNQISKKPPGQSLTQRVYAIDMELLYGEKDEAESSERSV